MTKAKREPVPQTLSDLANDCIGCQLCGSAAGHMTWPILGYFPPTAKILLIGQNPAESKNQQEMKEYLAKWKPNFDTVNPLEYLEWYSGWFRISTMCVELEAFFGRGWFDTGLFAITNAVRCRTKNNVAPTDIMASNCRKFTIPLLERYKYVIAMGSIARKQLGINADAPPKVYTFLETDRTVLCIGHYNWRPHVGDITRTREKQTSAWFIEQVKTGAWENGQKA